MVGSQSIQLIALRNETLAFSRKADAKIALLKEVIRRVQAGEDVDVEKMLGTGVEAQEKEWVEGKPEHSPYPDAINRPQSGRLAHLVA